MSLFCCICFNFLDQKYVFYKAKQRNFNFNFFHHSIDGAKKRSVNMEHVRQLSQPHLLKCAGKPWKLSCIVIHSSFGGTGGAGEAHTPQILVDQKTELSCHITTRQPRFSDLPPSLDWLSCLARTREETKWSGLNLLLYFLCLILLQKGDPKLQNSLFAPSTLCCPQ